MVAKWDVRTDFGYYVEIIVAKYLDTTWLSIICTIYVTVINITKLSSFFSNFKSLISIIG